MDIRRGVIATAAPPGSFGKPRPVLIVQSQFPQSPETVLVAYVTSDLQRQPGVRVPVIPTLANGLKQPSEIMVDILHSLPIGKLGRVIGYVEQKVMVEVDAALRLLPGLP